MKSHSSWLGVLCLLVWLVPLRCFAAEVPKPEDVLQQVQALVAAQESVQAEIIEASQGTVLPEGDTVMKRTANARRLIAAANDAVKDGRLGEDPFVARMAFLSLQQQVELAHDDLLMQYDLLVGYRVAKHEDLPQKLSSAWGQYVDRLDPTRLVMNQLLLELMKEPAK